jgi:predicted nucleic acid-binding protein
MISTAVLCDTGALLDYLVATSADHLAFKQAIDRAGTRYVPGLVLAEVDYFLREQREAMAALVADLSRGAFTYAATTISVLRRAMEIDDHFADLSLGLVDASIVALAEELGVTRLATRDIRDFAGVRLDDGSAFEFVVQPTRPDRSNKRRRDRSRSKR